MGRTAKNDPLPDAVMVSGKTVWAPPVEVGMACNTSRRGFTVMGRIVEVLDAKEGKVMVLADEGQESTVTTGDDYDGQVTLTLFTPGEPFEVSWKMGLHAVQRADGRWEQPVLEVIRENRKAVPGWLLSDAVRCDPAYRNRITGGGVQGSGGRFVGRGEGGVSVERRRWTTTLTPEALEVLRSMAEATGMNRNEVVEQLLLREAPSGVPAPAPSATPPAVKKGQTKDQRQLATRWASAAEHLKAAHDLIRLEKERLCNEYAGAHGSLIMRGRWQRMAKEWADSGVLAPFTSITGAPTANTLEGLLAELERASRMTNAWIGCIAVYTGCKPDPTRYKPPQDADAGKA